VSLSKNIDFIETKIYLTDICLVLLSPVQKVEEPVCTVLQPM